MTVAELIEELKKQPQWARVVVLGGVVIRVEQRNENGTVVALKT